ncbi:MAG: methyltransferase domain-containing protein [Myxococcota bacterium]
MTVASPRDVSGEVIHVPSDALPYILFQRTAYLRLPQSRAFQILDRLLPIDLYGRVVALESRVRSSEIGRLYQDDIFREYESLRPHLPPAPSSVLDIGCGVAGIDALLYAHYRDRSPEIHLLDKTAVEDRVFYQFEAKGAFYNSLEIARTTLESSGVPAERVATHEATEDNRIPLADGSVDLMLSLISWGFHYPVSTYLDEAERVLRPGGRLILDVRRGTSGKVELEGRFRSVAVARDEPKFERLVLAKP